MNAIVRGVKTVPVADRIDDVDWVRAFDSKGKECHITWVAANALGLKGVNENISSLNLEITIVGVDKPHRKLLVTTTFIKKDDEGVFHYFIESPEAKHTLARLLEIARIIGQSKELTIDQILTVDGLPEYTEVTKKSRKLPKWNQWASLVILAVFFLGFWVLPGLFGKEESGTVVTPMIIHEEPIRNGLFMEGMVTEGMHVKKGQALGHIVDSSLTGSFAPMDDRMVKARERAAAIATLLETKETELKTLKAVHKNTDDELKKFLKLQKEGYMIDTKINPVKEKSLLEQSTLERLPKEMSQLQNELTGIHDLWGKDFSKADSQRKILEKQIRGLEVLSKCDCTVHSVEPVTGYVRFKLIEDTAARYLAIPIESAKAVKFREKQLVQYQLPGKPYQKGHYEDIITNTNKIAGINAGKFDGLKWTFIQVVTDEQIPAGQKLGTPVTVIFYQNSFLDAWQRTKMMIQNAF